MNNSMGNIFVEVCLISGRGFGRSSSLFWKAQWYAVGWIDPDDKYCSKIDATADGNPVWRTKFSALVDDIGKAESKDVSLQVEVYRRDPIFLREKLQGTATIVLREFLSKRSAREETGSYQLRKRNSSKPRGFVDISIRVSEGGQHPISNSTGNPDGVLMLVDNDNCIALATPNDASLASTSYEPNPAGPSPLPLAAASHLHRPYQSKPEVVQSYAHPTPIPPNFSNPSVGGPAYPRAVGPSYLPPRPAPPMPLPPPSHGNYSYYQPAYLPDRYTSGTYFNMPSSAAAGRDGRVPMRYGAALGTGALGAGAVLVGDQVMSGYNMPSGFQDPSLIVSLDPPF